MPTTFTGVTVRLEVWDPTKFDPPTEDGKSCHRQDDEPLATAYKNPKKEDKPEVLMEEFFEDELYQATNFNGPVEHRMVKSGMGYFAPGYRRPTFEERLEQLSAAIRKGWEDMAEAEEEEEAQGKDNQGTSSSSLLPSAPSQKQVKAARKGKSKGKSIRKAPAVQKPIQRVSIDVTDQGSPIKSVERTSGSGESRSCELQPNHDRYPGNSNNSEVEGPSVEQQQDFETPKALRVMLTFTKESFATKAFRMGTSNLVPAPDMCVNVFYNGEFVHSRVINSRYRPKTPEQYSARTFAGRLVGNRMEVPFILRPPRDKNSKERTKVTETNAQRWRTIALSLNAEAENWREPHDNKSPMCRALKFISTLKMPVEMRETSEARKFGVVDVVITAGNSNIANKSIGAGVVFEPKRTLATGFVGKGRVMCSTSTHIKVPGTEESEPAKESGSAGSVRQVTKRKTRSHDTAESSTTDLQPDDEPTAKRQKVVLKYRKSAGKNDVQAAKKSSSQEEPEATPSDQSTKKSLHLRKGKPEDPIPDALRSAKPKEAWVPSTLNDDSVLTYGSEIYNPSNYYVGKSGRGNGHVIRKGAVQERETLFETMKLVTAVRFVCPG